MADSLLEEQKKYYNMISESIDKAGYKLLYPIENLIRINVALTEDLIDFWVDHGFIITKERK